VTPTTIWPHEEVGHNHEANNELKEFELAGIFDNPKPTRLIRRMLELATDASAKNIVLDFFAGSGTTAHAVLDLNKQDGGNRKFILVQLPEPTGREDYPTIADICKERVRRVIKKLNDEDAGKLDLDGNQKQDRGFRVFKLAESNFKPWNAEVPHDEKTLAEQLELHIDHIREGRLPEDILYEILLKSGFPLTTPVETITLAGKTVHSVAAGALFICLERELTLELIRAMAERQPERVVCLDEGFAGNDQLKANAVQIFKTKDVMSFKTV
jgi:adenine-specific DNA-methyltransferase